MNDVGNMVVEHLPLNLKLECSNLVASTFREKMTKNKGVL
jgi:hypothetical protein